MHVWKTRKWKAAGDTCIWWQQASEFHSLPTLVLWYIHQFRYISVYIGESRWGTRLYRYVGKVRVGVQASVKIKEILFAYSTVNTQPLWTSRQECQGTKKFLPGIKRPPSFFAFFRQPTPSLDKDTNFKSDFAKTICINSERARRQAIAYVQEGKQSPTVVIQIEGSCNHWCCEYDLSSDDCPYFKL